MELSETEKKAEKEYIFLDEIKDSADLFTNEKVLAGFAKIYLLIINTKKYKINVINLGQKYNFPEILFKYFDYNYNIFEEKIKLESEDIEEYKFYSFIGILTSIIRSFSNHSLNFCKDAHEFNGIHILFKFIKNQYLIDKYIKKFNESIESKENKENFTTIDRVIRGTIGCLVNLSKYKISYKKKWNYENAVETLLNLCDKIKHINDNEMAIYIILCTISEEKQIQKFPSLINVLPNLIELIKKMADSLEKKTNINRTTIELNEKNDELVKVCNITYKGTIWHLIELLDGLYNMTVNDTIKKNIYFDNDMKSVLKKIILNGNFTEIEYAVKMLWQLCFDDKISDDVFNDKELFNLIESFTQNIECTQGLVTNSKGILWLIKNKSIEITPRKEISEKKDHIMISYNRESKDLCLRIKQELEKDGHKIWIDVENISGSSLESMANAIENSKCVLMCMTEKYKQSSNCRLEAEYTINLNKPIIPLIMQKNFKPDGWLGLILGSKIFVNFTKYDYEECIRRLKHELKSLKLNNTAEDVQITTNEPLPLFTNNNNTHEKNQISSWDQSKVEKWLNEKKFNPVIIQNVMPCNGNILKQLFSMQKDAPEFFYSSISSNNSIPTRDVAFFSYELNCLFKNEQIFK